MSVRIAVANCFSHDNEENVCCKQGLREGTGKFKPRYSWMEKWLQDYDTKHIVITCLFIYLITFTCLNAFLILSLNTIFPLTKLDFLCIICYIPLPIASEYTSFFWKLFLTEFCHTIGYILFVSYLYVGICVIGALKQNSPTGKFQVPLVPLIPAISIFFNINLLMHLSLITWIRFAIWMVVGESTCYIHVL